MSFYFILFKLKYEKFDLGYRDLVNGQIWGIIYIDRNFTESIESYVEKHQKIPLIFDQKIRVSLDNTSNFFNSFNTNLNGFTKFFIFQLDHQISITIKEALVRSLQKVVEHFQKDIHLMFFLTLDQGKI
jgi:hypothetical protein